MIRIATLGKLARLQDGTRLYVEYLVVATAEAVIVTPQTCQHALAYPPFAAYVARMSSLTRREARLGRERPTTGLSYTRAFFNTCLVTHQTGLRYRRCQH